MVTSCSVHLCPSWHCILQLSSALPHVANWGELQRNEVLHSSGKKAQHLSQRPEGDREHCWYSAVYISPSISVSSITPLLSQ